MSELEANRDHPEPVRPDSTRRVVADWEYWTSYIQFFQVRIPEGLNYRLTRWAKQEHKPPDTLLLNVLEEAVRQRAEALTGGTHAGES